jgi:hypothetical protein
VVFGNIASAVNDWIKTNMKKIGDIGLAPLFAAALSLALCGCATSNETYNANGEMVYAIDCYAQTSAACTEKAGEICGILGYHFVKADGSRLPPPAPPPPISQVAAASTPAPAPASAPSAAPPATAAYVATSDDTWTSKPPVKSAAAASKATSSTDDSDSLMSNLKTIKIDRKMYIQCQS